MSYVVMQKEKYLVFDSFTRDLDVFVQVEPTSYVNLATEFMDQRDAKDFISIAKNSGYDTTEYQVKNKEELIENEKQAEENKKKAASIKAWNELNEEGKRAFISTLSEDDRKKFLETVEDTSGIQAYTKEEVAERRIQRLEKTLGITFTEEQKQILRTKEDL